MFVRKKNKLRIAYALLTATAFAAIAHDTASRDALALSASRDQQRPATETRAPLAITPLAQSPFSEARPGHADVALAADTRDQGTLAPKGGNAATAPRVYFLTVAIQVDPGTGPVAFNRGTRVLFLKEQDGKVLVRHHRADFLIEKSQVTDDLNVLTALARNSS